MKIDKDVVLKRIEKLEDLLGKVREFKSLSKKEFLSDFKNYFSF
ncbi:MAG: hypothetical protein R6U96_16570 [Promethearchaeia archaeon]